MVQSATSTSNSYLKAYYTAKAVHSFYSTRADERPTIACIPGQGISFDFGYTALINGAATAMCVAFAGWQTSWSMGSQLGVGTIDRMEADGTLAGLGAALTVVGVGCAVAVLLPVGGIVITGVGFAASITGMAIACGRFYEGYCGGGQVIVATAGCVVGFAGLSAATAGFTKFSTLQSIGGANINLGLVFADQYID